MPDLGDQQTAELTAGMASGDRSAVETFYRRYFDLLYAEARRATRRDEAFCLDVVQEGVLRIIRSVRRVASEAQLATWLRLVIRTTAFDMLRNEARFALATDRCRNRYPKYVWIGKPKCVDRCFPPILAFH